MSRSLTRLALRLPKFHLQPALTPRRTIGTTMAANLDAARAQVAEQIKVDIFTATQDEVRHFCLIASSVWA